MTQPISTPPTDTTTESTVQSLIDTFWNVWQQELFTLNDTPVKVSALIIAIIILIFGMMLSKIIARYIGKRVLPKMKVDQSAANSIQSLVYYILLSAAVLLSLQTAGLPLSALAFFGGAIALGIGFGSQNVINNFISGLILMIERPIRVGDLITIEGEIGVVQDIGARATKVESYLGSTFIVPNSVILENSVTNWNMPDSTVKTLISVGVAYGSDTAKVKKLLEQAMTEPDLVVDSDDNEVMFVGFGDSSLDFEIHCRIKPKNTQQKISLESSIRYRIDELFRENNIEIPFPQRDLHLRSATALEMKS